MNKTRLNLREIANPGCMNCGPTDRKEYLENGLCTTTQSVLDQLPVRCVGEWAYEKIYWLVQYFGIFAQGMKDSWHGLNYIEICSGPGRCIRRSTGTRMEMDGTALSIIAQPGFQLLTKALFIDADQTVVNALNSRIVNAKASNKAGAIIGDFNHSDDLAQSMGQLPIGCLNLVFFDPTECDLPFSTVQAIVRKLRNVDLIINVAIHTDANRNLANAITKPNYEKLRAKYETFLGSRGFCQRPDVIAKAQAGDHESLRRLFMDEYRKRLANERYIHTAEKSVRHYYHLLFASRSPKGLEFWNKACKIDPYNQRELDL
jgi:three-Cys-motif partner protein